MISLLKRFSLGSPSKRDQYQYGNIYTSQDGKGQIQEILKLDIHDSDIVATNKITHEDGLGSIIVKLHNIKKLKIKIKSKILNKSQQGKLTRAASLIKRYNRIDTNFYSHRLYILYKASGQYSNYLTIDFRLQSPKDKYIDSYASDILHNALTIMLEEPLGENYMDAIINLLEKSWEEYIIHEAHKYYQDKNIKISELKAFVVERQAKRI